MNSTGHKGQVFAFDYKIGQKYYLSFCAPVTIVLITSASPFSCCTAERKFRYSILQTGNSHPKIKIFLAAGYKRSFITIVCFYSYPFLWTNIESI